MVKSGNRNERININIEQVRRKVSLLNEYVYRF